MLTIRDRRELIVVPGEKVTHPKMTRKSNILRFADVLGQVRPRVERAHRLFDGDQQNAPQYLTPLQHPTTLQGPLLVQL